MQCELRTLLTCRNHVFYPNWGRNFLTHLLLFTVELILVTRYKIHQIIPCPNKCGILPLTQWRTQLIHFLFTLFKKLYTAIVGLLFKHQKCAKKTQYLVLSFRMLHVGVRWNVYVYLHQKTSWYELFYHCFRRFTATVLAQPKDWKLRANNTSNFSGIYWKI